MRCFQIIALLALALLSSRPLSAQSTEPWQEAYAGGDATGPHVIAFWNFDEEGEVCPDASGRGHDGRLKGARRCATGRFAGGIQSFPGWPVEDAPHAVIVDNAPELSPMGAFTLEMWIRPDAIPEGYGDSFLIDKKYATHSDYQWILDAPDKRGARHMRAVLGFGADSETWRSTEPAALENNKWSHVALTYDGAGRITFFQDGRSLGGMAKTGRDNISPGPHGLSLGDRIGSYYHGFPGMMDEVRITSGTREFRPLTITMEHSRTVFERMEPAPALKFRVANHRRTPVKGMEATINVAGAGEKAYSLGELGQGASQILEYPFDTRLRPDTYTITVSCAFPDGTQSYRNSENFSVGLVARKPPLRMPVVMWGVGGIDGVLENMDILKEIGFTHCLGLQCDFGAIWDANSPAPAADGNALANSYRMLDQAFANDLGIVISISPGAWLEEKEQFLRKDAAGKPYERPNTCCNFPEVNVFGRNVGASVAQTYGDFPAFDAALIHTEVRDGTQLCFHDHDKALYQSATGQPLPGGITAKNGTPFAKVDGFPESHVLPDDYPLLRFYRWFWREGDGWNGFHSAVNEGLKSTGRRDLWSFFDPAVRVPALWGSGGTVDYLSHWTYSYPDPIRIGLATDELFAMAEGGPEGQGVMKMTQIIWYRSQTAPQGEQAAPSDARSPWEDYDPGADYITIAPAHLREAFWTKIARPVRGIMYHGWQSLVPTEERSAYRHTHPETRRALTDLIARVVKPLGPTLLQVPALPSGVAFLESFTSAMFAGRGTYGWGGSWAGDAYHILMYAGLQPEVVYEETIMKRGLEGRKVLVLSDCDVLTEPVVAKIKAFQQAGGILIGDERLCPAVTPDILIQSHTRTDKADADKAALLARAEELKRQLGNRHIPHAVSSVADVLPYCRRFGTTDYVFAINDRREYGNYVGRHKLVMEQGLNAAAEFTLRRQGGHVYDLVGHRKVDAGLGDGFMTIPVDLEPGGGALFMVTANPLEQLTIRAPQEVKHHEAFAVRVVVADGTGAALDAVIPLEVRILDPDGRPAEFSGHYGAKNGMLDLELILAANDVPGIWTIEVRELASGMISRHYMRLSH